jgi:hypothetical protein
MKNVLPIGSIIKHVMLIVGVVSLISAITVLNILFGQNNVMFEIRETEILMYIYVSLFLYNYFISWFVLGFIIISGSIEIYRIKKQKEKASKRLCFAVVLCLLSFVINYCVVYFYLGRL